MLVANRGEIAVRVLRTLHAMGIRGVAVHSDADVDALHVRLADAAVRLGGADAADSYLRVDRVVDAAVRAGAEAIHPGYGFLSEQPALARACQSAGLTWIGPPAEAIEAMGDKARARRLMRDAGVPVVPGTDDGGLDDDALMAAATQIGFPIMVKPAAGGGGKGMLAVDSVGELRDALATSRRQARAAFGDGRLLLERLLVRPRHVEVQVLADHGGRVVSLGERDCSVQRRHQKVVEEAPAPGLDDGVRARLHAAAVDAARACGYGNAGTVECIMPTDGSGRFYFLEMNTRLQVEHPVTEAVTGLDLVEWQVRIAAGQPLPDDLGGRGPTGHAVEARIYAEDPARGFLPTGGSVLAYRAPVGDGVRVDSGVREGTVVPSTYDPLLAKVIAHGPDRETALRRLRAALAETVVLGMQTNVGFLRALLADDDVRSGPVDTAFVDRRRAALSGSPMPAHALSAAAMCLLVESERRGGTHGFDRTDGWRVGAPAWTVRRLRGPADAPHMVRWRGTSACAEVAVDERPPVTASLATVPGTDDVLVTVGECTRRYVAARADDTLWLAHDGWTWSLRTEPRLSVTGRRGVALGPVVAPMPGAVTAVGVVPGDRVAAGQTLITLEAMKMEHRVTAPGDGVVSAVTVTTGQQVAIGQHLVDVEPDASG